MEETKDGDFVIVGGDFNYDPNDNDEDETTFNDLEAAGLINAANAFTKVCKIMSCWRSLIYQNLRIKVD